MLRGTYTALSGTSRAGIYSSLSVFRLAADRKAAASAQVTEPAHISACAPGHHAQQHQAVHSACYSVTTRLSSSKCSLDRGFHRNYHSGQG